MNDLRASSADDELIITALQDIAALEMDLGNVDETNRLEGEILSIRRNAVKKFEDERGKTDPDTLGALEKLADTLAKYNHFDEELTVRRELLERLKAYPADEIIGEILKIKDAVAVALDNQNDFCAALKVRQEILSIYRKYFDDTDDEVIQALSKVADAFKKLDDYRAVLKTRREIVKIYEEKFPDDKANSDLIEARINESDILIELEDFDAALDIYLESVELYTKKYGKSGYKHDDTLDVRHKIARLYVRKKDFENAVNEYEEIISLLKENYSESHHKVIKLTSELDDLRDKINSADFDNKKISAQLATAIEYRHEILNSLREIFGNGYYNALKVFEKMARKFERISRESDADKMREEKLKVYDKIKRYLVKRFGESNKFTLDLMCAYAAELGQLKRYDEAEKILSRADELYKSDYGNLQLNWTPFKLENADDLNAAVNLCKKYIAELKEKFSGYEFCRIIINALKTLINLHVARKDFDSAIAVQNEIVGLLKRRYEGYENHSNIINAQNEVEKLTALKNKSAVEPAVEPVKLVRKGISLKLRKKKKLLKGDNQSLTKNNPQLSQLKVKFGWDAAELEIDKSAFLLGANGKVRVDEDSGDIKVDLTKIPADVSKIEFTLTIYDAEENGQNFSKITGAYISIIDAQSNKEILPAALKCSVKISASHYNKKILQLNINILQ